MKTLLLSIVLVGLSFSNLSAKERHKQAATETVSQVENSIETNIASVPLKPGNASAKTRTLRAGLIMMGAGVVSTLTGAGLALGASEDQPTKGAVGVGLFIAGFSSTVSGAVVTIIGLALPRD